MIKRRKANHPNDKKPPFLPQWAWNGIFIVLGKALGAVALKGAGALFALLNLPWSL